MPTAESPVLFGVLVTYRRPGPLAEFLRALAAQHRHIDHLIVVDNDPTEETRRIVETGTDAADIRDHVPMSENTGPAGGFSEGMRRALDVGSDGDWMVLLDDDNPPKDDALLERLLGFGQRQQGERPPVGLVGKTGARFDLRGGRTVRLRDEELHGVVDVDYVASGQFPLISLAAARRVGVHNPELFFSFEDLDFGLRLRDAGYSVLVDGSLALEARTNAGRLGGDFGKRSLTRTPAPWRRYYSTRNHVWLLRQHGRRRPALVLTTTALAKTVVLALRRPSGAGAHLRLGVRAVVDGWRGRLGRTVEPSAGTS
jgi:glycosyltransferase involved in cell wall biosynthesis